MATSPNNIIIRYQRTKYHHEILKRPLKFFYANVQNILKERKLIRLKVTLKLISNDVDVIVLVETWIKTYEDARQVELDGYKHFFNIREGESQGGGISIYVKTDLKPWVTVSKFQGGVNYLWVHLKTEALDIGGIYNPAGDETDNTQFLKEYSKQLNKMQQAIVFGDFNIDLLASESNTKTRNYKKTLEEAGYTLLNKINSKYSTRTTKEGRAILDHVSTNLSGSEYKFHLAVLKSNYLCDHHQLYLGVDKMLQSEDTNPPRNKKPRTNSKIDTRQTYEDEEDTEKVTSESSEASETEEINQARTTNDADDVNSEASEASESEKINHDRTTNDADDVTSEASEASETEEINHDRTTNDADNVTSEASETEENNNTKKNGANAAETKTYRRSKEKLAVKVFMCQLCDKIFTCQQSCRRHLNSTHGITSVERRCPNCGLSFERKVYNQHLTSCSERLRKRKRSSTNATSRTRALSNNDRGDKDGDDSDRLESSSSEDTNSNDDEHGSNDDDSSSDGDDNNICNEDAKRNAVVGLAKLFLSLQSEKLLKKKGAKDA